MRRPDEIGAMALTLMCACGGMIGVFIGLHPPPGAKPGYSLISGAFALAIAAGIWSQRRHVRHWMLHVAAGGGLAAVSYGAYAGHGTFTGRSSPYFYLWEVLVVFAVFSARVAGAYLAANCAAYALVLATTHAPEGFATWIVVTGTMIGAGVVVGVLRARLRDDAGRDPLTALRNRQSLDDWLGEAETAVRVRDQAATVALLDLNDFKQVNDQWGHQHGDEILVAVADELLQQVRAQDVVVRYGGDEFVLILPQTDSERARHLLGRLRLPIRCSAGLAAVRPGDSAAAILHRADADLYQAKQRSRSCGELVTLA